MIRTNPLKSKLHLIAFIPIYSLIKTERSDNEHWTIFGHSMLFRVVRTLNSKPNLFSLIKRLISYHRTPLPPIFHLKIRGGYFLTLF